MLGTVYFADNFFDFFLGFFFHDIPWSSRYLYYIREFERVPCGMASVFCFVFFKQQPQHQADKDKNSDVEQRINQITHLFHLHPL
jgi:hypothetical protein